MTGDNKLEKDYSGYDSNGIELSPAISEILKLRQVQTLVKGGKFQSAFELAEKVYSVSGNPEAGRNMAFCLRKMGKLGESLEMACLLLEAHPESLDLKREKFWALYEAGLKPAVVKKDLELTIAYADLMMSLDSGVNAGKVAIFAVMTVARKVGKHDIVIDWAQRLSPGNLSLRPAVYGNRRGLSDRERYYYMLINAMMAKCRFNQARTVALEAIKCFPKSTDFRRWAALAANGSGDRRLAMDELSELAANPRSRWYIAADCSKLHLEASQPEKAWEWALRAARNNGDLKLKVNLFDLMGRILKRLDKPDAAANHFELTVSIRINNDWAIPPELVAACAEFNIADPVDPETALHNCKRHWQSFTPCLENHDAASTIEGTVKLVMTGKGNGFITPDGNSQDVFFMAADMPESCRHAGARVRFVRISDYDETKQRASMRAVKIEPIAKPREKSEKAA